MLAARRLPEVLKSVLNDGVDGCCLMTEEGSILAAAFTEKSSMIDTSLAAISSSVWNNISKGTSCRASQDFLLISVGTDFFTFTFPSKSKSVRLLRCFLAYTPTGIRVLRNNFSRQGLYSCNLRKECAAWIAKRSFRYLKRLLYPHVRAAEVAHKLVLLFASCC